MYYFAGGVYIVLSFFSLLNIHRIKIQQKKAIFYFMLFYASVLMACRPEDIPDFLSYKRIFEFLQPGEKYGFALLSRHYETGVEYGFLYLIYIIKFIIGDKFRIFLGILTFTTVSISIKYMKKICVEIGVYEEKMKNQYELELILLVIYSSYYLLVYEGIAIRTACASCLCLVAFEFYLRKKYIFVFGFLFIAFTMHRMAIIGAGAVLIYIFFPCLKNRINYVKVTLISFIVTLIIFMSPLYELILKMMKQLYDLVFIDLNYSGYTDGISLTASLDKKRIFLMIIFLFALCYLDKNNGIFKLYNIFLCGIVLMICTMNIAGSARIYDYLVIYYLPILGVEFIKNRQSFKYECTLSGVILINYIISLRIWGTF